MSSKELDALANDVAQLSSLFTREREELPPAYLKNERFRKAYQAYFVPSNILKIHVPLQELARHPRGLPPPGLLRVLDLGSGPGTASFGVLDFFSQRPDKPVIQFTLLDQVKESLDDARAIHRALQTNAGLNSSLRTLRGTIERAAGLCSGERFDIIILSNSMNELYRGEEDRLSKRILLLQNLLKRLLSEHGSCIIIEPALQETSRETIALRDGMLEDGFHIYSPCLMQERCPAFLNPKDWCHEDRPWDPPAIVKEIDSRIGLRKDSLKFSYMILRRDEVSLSACYGENAFRIVSEPLRSKGKIEYYLCGRGSRKIAIRLDKDETAMNRSFEQMSRGAIVEFNGLAPEEKRYRVMKDTEVIVRDL